MRANNMMRARVLTFAIMALFGFCYIYGRLSNAWGAVARYANDNRESCHISVASLSDFERYHSEAVKDRDNVCAGRPLRPYGADIIQH